MSHAFFKKLLNGRADQEVIEHERCTVRDEQVDQKEIRSYSRKSTVSDRHNDERIDCACEDDIQQRGQYGSRRTIITRHDELFDQLVDRRVRYQKAYANCYPECERVQVERLYEKVETMIVVSNEPIECHHYGHHAGDHHDLIYRFLLGVGGGADLS